MWFNFVPVLTDPDCIMVCREGGDAPVRETIYIVDYILLTLNALARLFEAMPVHMKPCGLVHSFMSTRMVFSDTGKVVGTIFTPS